VVFASQRLRINLPYLVALLVLLLIGWSVVLMLAYPSDGILSIDQFGLVSEIDLSGPSAGKLQEEDQILSVDGIPVLEAVPYYVNKYAGDFSTLIFRRGESISSIEIRLAKPSLTEWLDRLAPLFLALIFLGVGVGVQAFKPTREGGILYFLFFVAGATFWLWGLFLTWDLHFSVLPTISCCG
jgi:hypothetical protein